MDMAETIKEINTERKREMEHINFQKSIDEVMKYAKEIYDAAINNGFEEDQANYYAYLYYTNTMNIKQQ